MQAWLKVFLAAIMEVGWVIGLKHAQSAPEMILTVALMIASNALLILSAKSLPVGTAYAVFVGLGTAGAVLADLLIFKTPMTWLEIFFVACILLGAVGLQALTPIEKEREV